MNLNNFTIKAAEVIQQAQQLAFNLQNPNIERCLISRILP
jgi:ATP-dependent Clp protease ATP-binding subunit ClpB